MLGQSQDEFKQAKEERDRLQLLGLLGKAGSKFGTAAARIKPHETPVFDALLKQAGQPIEDIHARQALAKEAMGNLALQQQLTTDIEKANPNSMVSNVGKTIFQESAKAAGININPEQLTNLSLSQMEKLLPGIENMANKKMMAAINEMKFADLSETRKANLTQRIEHQTNQEMSKETGSYINNLDTVARTEDVFKKIRSGELKTSQNVAASLQNDVAQLLSNAKSTAVYDRSHAEIKALSTTWNNILSFATSRPRDTIPPEYLSQLEKEISILKHSVLTNYQRRVDELKSGTKNSEKKDIFQNRYETQLKSRGYNPKSLKQEGELMEHAAKEPAIQSFMKANGIEDRDEAIKILKSAGRL